MENQTLAVCPHCGCKLNLKRYEKHLLKQHSPEAELRKARERAKIAEERERRRIAGLAPVKCDLCKITVLAKRLNRHKARIHGIGLNVAHIPKKKQAQPPIQGGRKVEASQVSVRPQVRLPKDATVVLVQSACSCGGENANCFKCFGTGFYEKKEVLELQLPLTTKSVPARTDRLPTAFSADARGGGYAIRESGRFLSNPLHDDYGEESSR